MADHPRKNSGKTPADQKREQASLQQQSEQAAREAKVQKGEHIQRVAKQAVDAYGMDGKK